MKKWLYYNVVCRLLDLKIRRYYDGLTECFINNAKKMLLFTECCRVARIVINDNYNLRSQYYAYRTISEFINLL